MSDDPILALEHELLRAAERLTVRPAAAPVPRKPARRIGGVLALAAALIPVLLVVGAVVVVRGSRSPSPTASTGPARQSLLVAQFGVFRRQQTAADRPPWLASLVRSTDARLDRSSLRLVNVPLAGAPTRADVPVGLALATRPNGTPELSIVVPAVAPTSQPLVPTKVVRVEGAAAAGTAREGGMTLVDGSPAGARTDLVVLAPDDVRRVQVTAPGAGPVVAAVQSNAVAFSLAGSRSAVRAAGLTVTEYGAGGRVIRVEHQRSTAPSHRGPGLGTLRRALPAVARPQRPSDLACSGSRACA